MGATHTFMWVGKRVQREARNHDRPSGNAFRRGEPTSNEYANADENEPKRVVDVGGRSPGAKRSAAPRWEGQAFSLMVRQRHEQGNIGDNSRRSPRRGEPRIARAPEDSFIVRWRNISSERQTEIGIQGVQPCKSSEIHDSGSTYGRLDGAYL